MATESLAWPDPPTLTDAVDSGQSYNMGCSFQVSDAVPWAGVAWRVPDSVSAPSGGVHAVALWNDGTGERLSYQEISPTPGGNEDFLVDPGNRVDLVPGQTYIASVYTMHYVFRSGSPAGVTSPSGTITAVAGRLAADNAGAAAAGIPSGTFNAIYYISPIIDLGGAEDHVTSGSAAAVAGASVAIAKRAVAAASAAAAAGTAAAMRKGALTTGTAAAEASAAGITATARGTSGAARAAVAATAVITTARYSLGTARAVAGAGTYSAQGAPGPWLISRSSAARSTVRNGERRIVTRVQVAG